MNCQTYSQFIDTHQQQNWQSQYEQGNRDSHSSPSSSGASETNRCHRTDDKHELRRKRIHNEIEKRRRKVIGDKLHELAEMLPMSNCPNFKRNKGTILSEVVEYVRQLQQCQRQVQTLQMQNKQLNEWNQQAQQKLFSLQGFSSKVPLDMSTVPMSHDGYHVQFQYQ